MVHQSARSIARAYNARPISRYREFSRGSSSLRREKIYRVRNRRGLSGRSETQDWVAHCLPAVGGRLAYPPVGRTRPVASWRLRKLFASRELSFEIQTINKDCFGEDAKTKSPRRLRCRT